MTTLPLTAANVAQLREIEERMAALKAEQLIVLRAIIGTQLKPGAPEWNWAIGLTTDSITLTPPELREVK